MTDTQRFALSKVPEVTLGFWIIKILATTLGEVGGNAVTMQLGFGYLIGSAIFGGVLIVPVAAQIMAKRFHAFLYWAVIGATTLTGTTLAHFFDRSLGIGYWADRFRSFRWSWRLSAFGIGPRFGRRTDRRLTESRGLLLDHDHVLTTLRKRLATGWPIDGLGYNGSALVIALLLAVIAVFYFFTGVSRTLLFSAAFILTRPLGATIANSFDKPVAQGGLAVGDLKASAILAMLIVILIFLVPQRPGQHVGYTASS